MIRLPLKETIRSPGRMPAFMAGAAGSLGRQVRGACWVDLVTAITHRETLSTVVVATLMPWPMKTTPKSRNARTRLVITPDTMTTTFFHHGSR